MALIPGQATISEEVCQFGTKDGEVEICNLPAEYEVILVLDPSNIVGTRYRACRGHARTELDESSA